MRPSRARIVLSEYAPPDRSAVLVTNSSAVAGEVYNPRETDFPRSGHILDGADDC